MTTPNNPSRRAMLGALAGTPFLVGAIGAAVASPALAAPADTSEWDTAFHAWEQARAAYNSEAASYDRLGEVYQAARSAVPHYTTRRRYQRSGKRGTGALSTASAHDLGAAKVMVERQDRLQPVGGKLIPESDYIAACRELLTAHKARCERIEAIDRRLGYDEASDRIDALCRVEWAAEKALLQMPAPHAGALLWKIEQLFGRDIDDRTRECCDSIPVDQVAPMIADARRLLDRAA